MEMRRALAGKTCAACGIEITKSIGHSPTRNRRKRHTRAHYRGPKPEEPMSFNNRRRSIVLGAAATSAAALLTMSTPAFADPIAYWRWETGPANTNVIHTLAPGQFEGTIPDFSGNGNTLSVWEQGGGAGYQYRTDVPFAT